MTVETVLENLRQRAATTLGKATEGLDAKALYELVKTSLEAERAAFIAAHRSGSTLTLNALLDIEMQIREKIFNVPRVPIKA